VSVNFDENRKIIDVRLYKKEIFDFCSPWSNKWKLNYEYRSEPVPYVHSKRRIKCYRRPHTSNEKRMACAPEVQEYIRPKRKYKNLVDSRSLIPRHIDKSWKNKKIEKQWMKNL